LRWLAAFKRRGHESCGPFDIGGCIDPCQIYSRCAENPPQLVSCGKTNFRIQLCFVAYDNADMRLPALFGLACVNRRSYRQHYCQKRAESRSSAHQTLLEAACEEGGYRDQKLPTARDVFLVDAF
jgi:hypothetical protein